MDSPTAHHDFGTGWHVRPVAGDDWDAIAEIRNAYEPYGATGELLRQRHSLYGADDQVQVLTLVDRNLDVIGYCRAAHRQSDPQGAFQVGAYVRPDHVGKGLGRQLLELAEAFALGNGGTIMLAHAEACCPRCLSFAEAAGYRREQYLFDSRLELASFDPSTYDALKASLEAEGFTFGTMADEGDSESTWRRLYELDKETDQDTPGSENWNTGTFQEYVDAMRILPGFSLEAVHVAVYAGLWAGVNIVTPTTKMGEIQTNYTGVRREFRGKGLALALKVEGLKRAKRMGGTLMVTNNDDRNAPMLAINRKLGFVAKPGFYILKKLIG